jgi:hypothetical protein
LFCISVFWFPYNLYFISDKSCFVYLCSAFPIIGIFVSQALFCIFVFCFPYYWYFCLTSVVLYICVLLSLLLVFYVSQRVVLYICVMISLWFIFYVSQELFCIFVFCFPYYWYLMSHNRCFVYLFYDFPIIGILCFTIVVLYIFVMISL